MIPHVLAALTLLGLVSALLGEDAIWKAVTWTPSQCRSQSACGSLGRAKTKPNCERVACAGMLRGGTSAGGEVGRLHASF